MKVSFIIPLYNCLPLTQAMLASLRATLPPGLAHEIILVDDGSTDGTREWLASLRDPPFRVVLNERNLGYAGANNRGAALARGEFLALLNNDLILTARWLEPMLAVHDRLGASAGAVGNVQRHADTGAVDHTGIFINARGKPEHDRILSCRYLLPGLGWQHADAVTGACMIVRHDLWRQLGGFDEAYVNGCEDVDFCFRAAAAGRTNAVALRSVVRHHVSASPRRKLRDEENTYRLTLRWRDTLAGLAAREWCRNLLEQYREPSAERAGPGQALAALLYWSRLRFHPPSSVITRTQFALENELRRWRSMFPHLQPDSRNLSPNR
ncbi:MAG: glycosyltransferase family 2 protein [Opitutaceae bacterium]|nr:glycosyltransferase family 2 protein [Opitutaceae bacterium]